MMSSYIGILEIVPKASTDQDWWTNYVMAKVFLNYLKHRAANKYNNLNMEPSLCVCVCVHTVLEAGIFLEALLKQLYYKRVKQNSQQYRLVM